MDAELKKTLKAVTLELRHLLEGRYDSAGKWKPGDLEQRLAAIGVRRDRASMPVDEHSHLAQEDRQARKVVDAYLKLRQEAGVERSDAVAELVRETAFTWANRLLALRCMEARELIDPVILQQEAYGGRSLEHHRLAQRHPELCSGDDDGLFAVLAKVFREQAQRLPMLFDPQAPGIALRPAPAALKDCFGLLSLDPDTLRKYRIRLKEDETASAGAELPNPFTAPDALGWAYQYWNTEEKERVFERVRTVKGAQIAGADIVPATQLYTEDYMVKFLVQNSLGATWMGMHPKSRLVENWEYYVEDADRASVERKPVREITFLDPACGSGHFLLEAFDVFYAMYQEEGELTGLEAICDAILTRNLFGIDIDARAVQIAEVALWMKAAERAFDYRGVPTNLVAATASHLKGEAWEEFLSSFQREPSVARVLRKFAQTMEHIDEIGSLARPAEDLREIIREEHATWEGQVRERKEANFLFPEMRDEALSGRLSFQEISDEEFGERLFYRARASIDAFTEQARSSGDFEDQMLGSETRSGFRLVDLLGRLYDVVAANPPYMGNKTMSATIKTHLDLYNTTSKQDLYVAFMDRCTHFGSKDSKIAFVTQHSWMFASGLSRFRGAESLDNAACGFLRENTLGTLAHLGPGGFTEISGEVVNSALLVFLPRVPNNTSRFIAIRAVESDGAACKAAALRNRNSENCFSVLQHVFLTIPGAPLAYWLDDECSRLLARGDCLAALADVLPGLKTGNDARFLRFHWEVPAGVVGWLPYSKGGSGYAKWYGQGEYCVNWRNERTPFRQYRDSRQPYSSYYGKNGFTFSAASKGALGVRALAKGAIFGAKGPGVFPKTGSWVIALMNSRVCSYFIRSMTVSLDILVENVRAIPAKQPSDPVRRTLESCVDHSVISKKAIETGLLTDREFSGLQCFLKTAAADCCRLLSESVIERLVAESYELTECALNRVYREVGPHPGTFPLIAGYDQPPQFPDDDALLPDEVSSGLAEHERRALGRSQLEALRVALRALFEGAPEANLELQDDSEERAEDEDEPALMGSPMPIPPETFFEELCQRQAVHPVSVYRLLEEGITRGHWRCPPEEKRLLAGRVTAAVLGLLGHRLPKQIEAVELVNDWADPDGIIPLTPIAHESTLFELVGRRLTANEGDVIRFAEVMVKPLDSWLAAEFFKHHTKQFKKRPIAWQLQSGKFMARTSPAFACLLYYQRLDVDALPKLRSQYVGPLRQRLETELRGLTAIAAEARSERQVKRRAELEDCILELQKFDTTLEAVSSAGFGPPSLYTGLRQYAFDDAMLALKACWLRRLSELIAKSPLPDWLDEADHTDLHPDLRLWIADAMAHLDYSCVRVGAKPPDQGKLVSDPTAADLAKLISPQAQSMLKDALVLACDSWWKPFEAVVLGPDKDQIKAQKEEQKACEQKTNADPAPSSAEARHLRSRVKEIKEAVKALTARIKKRTAQANELRTQIERWESKEPLSWGNWLAGQPLFDRISSLDGRRATPTTIAEFVAQESLYAPDLNDGVRVNIAPLQKAGILAADVLAAKDIDKAIADRAEWRADERRWVREGKLPQPGWWTDD